MKSNALFQFVKSLSEDEMKRFISLVKMEENGTDLERIVMSMQGMENFQKSAFKKLIRIGHPRLLALLEQINGAAFHLMADQYKDGRLHSALLAARKLVFRQADEAAIDVMEWAFAEAERVERFDIGLDLLELTTIIVTPYPHEMPSKRNLIQKQMNLLAYQEIEEQFREFLSDVKDDEPKKPFGDIESSPLLESRSAAKSKRALTIFLKVKAVVSLLGQEVGSAELLQREFLDLIEDNHWIKIENDFFFIKESIQLSTILIFAGKFSEANEHVFRIGNRTCIESRSNVEKFKQLFPFKITVGILIGSEETVEASIQSSLALIKEHRANFSNSFITLNLYHCAYGYITIGEYQKATRIFNMAKEFNSGHSYLKRILPMLKILRMINMVYLGDLVNIPTMISRFRKSKHFEANPFYKTVLGILFRISNKEKAEWPSILKKFEGQITELKESEWASLFHYFELEYWLESLSTNRPMADSFRHRALSANSDSSSRKIG